MDFKKGDIVQLKSGGPAMVVTGEAGEGVQVLWYGEIVDEILDRRLHRLQRFALQHPALRVRCGELEAFQRDVVVIGDERPVLEQDLGMVARLVGIAGEDALIEVFHRRQRGPITEQHVEEFKVLDVAAEHHQQHGEGRRQDQPDRSP